MPTTHGPNSPASGASGIGGGTAWTNPTNVTSSNDSRATCNLTSATSSNPLECTQYGFSLTSDPVGIEVSIERRGTTGGTGTVRDSDVQLMIGGSMTGDNKADTLTPWPASDTAATYGGAADLWGLTPTAAQINASDFGVGIIITNSSLDTAQGEVDHVTVTVTEGDGTVTRRFLPLLRVG